MKNPRARRETQKILQEAKHHTRNNAQHKDTVHDSKWLLLATTATTNMATLDYF